jgi:hypothetical protein
MQRPLVIAGSTILRIVDMFALNNYDNLTFPMAVSSSSENASDIISMHGIIIIMSIMMYSYSVA